MGPIQCSVKIEGIGRESMEAHLKPDEYKEEVGTPAPDMTNSIFTISESSYNTARMNSYKNANIAIERCN